MVELYALKLLLDDESYSKYRHLISNEMFAGETSYLLKTIDLSKKKGIKGLTIEKLYALFNAYFTTVKADVKENVKEIVKQMKALSDDKDIEKEVVGSIIKKHYANQLVDKALEIINNPKEDLLVIDSVLQSYKKDAGLIDDDNKHLVTKDINEIMKVEGDESGYSWFSDYLTDAFGKIRGGDLALVAGYVNSGKSAFAISMAVGLTKQKARVLHINNEERATKYMLRYYCNYLNMDKYSIINNLDKVSKVKDEINNYTLLDIAELTLYDLKLLIEKHKPEVIIIDQAHKIYVAKEDRKDLEMGAIFRGLRELAKTYNVFIMGVTQANGEAINKKFLTMDNLFNTKVAVQAEVDLLVTIGIDADDAMNADLRYITCPKNKITGNNSAKIIMKLDNLKSKYIDIE